MKTQAFGQSFWRDVNVFIYGMESILLCLIGICVAATLCIPLLAIAIFLTVLGYYVYLVTQLLLLALILSVSWCWVAPFLMLFILVSRAFSNMLYNKSAFSDYLDNRANGCEADSPSANPPNDGNHYHEYDSCIGCFYWSFVQYKQGSGDKTWMEERDKNYLERIEREGKLKELEPEIYLLREREHATNNIRDWWTAKLLLPNLPQILKAAKDQREAITFLSGSHPRTGVNSPINSLPPDTARQIIGFASSLNDHTRQQSKEPEWWPRAGLL
jgi:hypothetical protein